MASPIYILKGTIPGRAPNLTGEERALPRLAPDVLPPALPVDFTKPGTEMHGLLAVASMEEPST